MNALERALQVEVDAALRAWARQELILAHGFYCFEPSEQAIDEWVQAWNAGWPLEPEEEFP